MATKLTKIYVKVTPNEELGVYTGLNNVPYSLAVVLARVFEMEIGGTTFQLAVHIETEGDKYVVTDVRSGCRWPEHIKHHHYQDEQGNTLNGLEAAKQYVHQQLTNAARNHAGPAKVASMIMSWPELKSDLYENGILEEGEPYPEI